MEVDACALAWPLAVPAHLRVWPDGVGQFAARRRNDVHTGVDLYCELGTDVVAMERGRVVAVEWFTGQHCPAGDSALMSTWWNDTQIILIEGSSGVLGYGEVTPDTVLVKVGEVVDQGQPIAKINRAVLRSNKGRPMVMLHVERYACLMPPVNGMHTAWWGLTL